MEIFSRFASVEDVDGKPMDVSSAMDLVAEVFESIVARDDCYDAPTRWALRWFRKYGTESGPIADAESLGDELGLSLSAISDSGIASISDDSAQVLSYKESSLDVLPRDDPPIWLLVQHLVRTSLSRGPNAAAESLRSFPNVRGLVRDLAYRLYTISERRGLTEHAMTYNRFCASWAGISRLASQPTPQRLPLG